MDTSTTYNLNDEMQLDRFAAALNSTVRRKMLRLLGSNSYSVIGLAEKLNLSVSTTTFHLKFLKDANLVKVLPNPNKRGNEKIVAQGLASVTVDLKTPLSYKNTEFIIFQLEAIPISTFNRPADLSMQTDWCICTTIPTCFVRPND